MGKWVKTKNKGVLKTRTGKMKIFIKVLTYKFVFSFSVHPALLISRILEKIVESEMRYLQRLYSTKNKHTRRDGAGYVLNEN